MSVRPDLRNYHFFEWTLEERKALKRAVLAKLREQFKLIPAQVQQILATGSRIYLVPNGEEFVEVFKPDSDLDVIVVIDTEDFIVLAKQDTRAKYPLRTWEDAVSTGITFSKVPVSIFLMPPDAIVMKFYGFQLPNVDIITLKINNLYEYDALDYIINVRGRIEPFTYCMVCETKKSCDYMFYYHIVDSNGNTVDARSFHICQDCYEQLFKGMDKYKVANLFADVIQGDKHQFEKKVKQYINEHSGRRIHKHHKTAYFTGGVRWL